MLSDREHHIASQAINSASSSSGRRYEMADRYSIRGRQVVLYAGTFEPYQGLELLVDAAPIVNSANPDTAFLCVGGSEAQISALRERARVKRVENCLIFPGTVPPEHVEAHFALADVLVSLRVSGTNTPLKIYSYLRSGVPILATNIRSHTQVLTPDVAVLVEPHADAIAAGLLTLLKDKGLRCRLQQNACKLAQEAFSSEAYYTKVAQVYAFLESGLPARPT